MKSRRAGPIEAHLRHLVTAHLRERGHGAATVLGRDISRDSSWVGQFVRGERRATIDDAVAIVRALHLRPNPLNELTAAPPPLVDEAQARLEARWLRLLRRLGEGDLLDVAFLTVEALARKRGKRKTTPPVLRKR
jgi:hypothetical protein